MKKSAIKKILSGIGIFSALFLFLSPVSAIDTLDVNNDCASGYCNSTLQTGYWIDLENFSINAITQYFYSSTSSLSGFSVRVNSGADDTCGYSIYNSDDTNFISGTFGSGSGLHTIFVDTGNQPDLLTPNANNKITISCGSAWLIDFMASASDIYPSTCMKPADGGDIPCDKDLFLITYYDYNAPVIPEPVPAPSLFDLGSSTSVLATIGAWSSGMFSKLLLIIGILVGVPIGALLIGFFIQLIIDATKNGLNKKHTWQTRPQSRSLRK